MNILRERLGVNDGSGRVLFQRGAAPSAEAKLREEADAWGKAVGGIVSSRKPRRSTLMFTQTPLVMHMLGADFKELHAASHVFDGLFPDQARRGHNAHSNITADILKQLPETMADPIMVFDSKESGRLTFMLGVKDANGATVIVPVDLEGQSGNRKITNIAVSAFAKENNGVPNNQWFVQQAQKGLRYIFVRLSSRSKTILTEADLDKLKTQYPSSYQGGGAFGPSGGKSSSEPRGSVVFVSTPEGEARALIRLFKGRDFSTVLHEATHVWTKDLERIGEGGLVTRAFEERIAAWGALPPDMADMAGVRGRRRGRQGRRRQAMPERWAGRRPPGVWPRSWAA